MVQLMFRIQFSLDMIRALLSRLRRRNARPIGGQRPMIDAPSCKATRPSRLLVSRPFLFPAQAFKGARERERSSREVLTEASCYTRLPPRGIRHPQPSPTDDKTRKGMPRGVTPLPRLPGVLDLTDTRRGPLIMMATGEVHRERSSGRQRAHRISPMGSATTQHHKCDGRVVKLFSQSPSSIEVGGGSPAVGWNAQQQRLWCGCVNVKGKRHQA